MEQVWDRGKRHDDLKPVGTRAPSRVPENMNEPIQIEYGLSNADSPENNLLRAVFTCFLNTGALDQLMCEADLKPKSARSDHVGYAFMIPNMEEIRNRFLAWVKGEPLARFIMDNDHTRDRFMERFPKIVPAAHSYWSSPVDAILGTRFKEVTGFNRARMPKDLKKSFYVKASNRLMKLTAEFEKTGAKWLRDAGSGKYTTPTLDQWLRLALSSPEKTVYLPSRHLREIRDLFIKTMRHEPDPVDDIVQELVKQAQVAGVMIV